MIAMMGASDQPCWLAEACKILLLFVLVEAVGCVGVQAAGQSGCGGVPAD